MKRFQVTLKNGQGERVLAVVAADEWHARVLAIRQNVSEGGRAMWCQEVSAGRSLCEQVTLDNPALRV